LTDKNLKASFDLARHLMQAKDIHEVLKLQSDFMRNLYATTIDHFHQMTGGVMAAAQNTAKANSEGVLRRQKMGETSRAFVPRP
jgi:hypothetical protein